MNPQDQIENPMEPWDYEEDARNQEFEDQIAETEIDKWMDQNEQEGEV